MPTRPRALVADDEPSVRAFLCAALTQAGFDVTEAPDGAVGADELLGGTEFAVAVLDCEMPGLRGPELLALVRQAGCRVPVLMVSATATPATIPGLAADPHSAFLPKPLRVAELLGAIARLLAGQSPT